MKYLKSFHPYEMTFRTSLKATPITLPRRVYKRGLLAAGRRNIMSVTDAQLAQLNQSRTFQALLKAGQKGGYVVMDTIPEHLKTDEERLSDERAKNAALEAELAALKGKKKDRTPPAKPAPAAKTDEAKAPPMTVKGRMKQLNGMSNKDLFALATDLGIENKGVKRGPLVALVLAKETDAFVASVRAADPSTLARMADAPKKGDRQAAPGQTPIPTLILLFQVERLPAPRQQFIKQLFAGDVPVQQTKVAKLQLIQFILAITE